MTRTIGLVDRIRWMVLVAALGTLALAWSVALAAGHGQLPSLRGASSSSPSGSSAPLDPRITGIAARHPNEVVQTIVQFKAGVGVERARWDVARMHGTVFGELPIINGLAVRLTAARARQLAASSDVHAVSLNSAVTVQNAPLGPPGGPGGPGGRGGPGGPGSATANLLTTYAGTLGVTPAWQAGITGEGVGVAVIDTGIDGNLPDFQAATGHASRVVETAVTNPKAETAIDTYGHGTDVAGIIAGDGDNLNPSDPLHGQYVGVAPRADLISIKVSDEEGRASVLDVIYGLQFAVDHRSDFNIRVVNLSLDAETPQSYTTDPLDAAVESAWMHGIVVVAAAGNRGTSPDAVQYAPANDPYVITVGAVDENGTPNPADDTIAPWSSRGITQDGFQKPDVYAPGANIVSVLAPDSQFASMCPSCIIGGEYIRTSGTSMATPMISGLVALMLQAHPSWTPDQVKGALMDPSVASNPSLKEVDAAKVLALGNPVPADGGLTPNRLVNGATGAINYSQSSWSQSSWSQATGSLAAGFAQSSWSCTCVASDDGGVGPSTSSWSTSSWSTYFGDTSTTG
jgi:serine protease AprX